MYLHISCLLLFFFFFFFFFFFHQIPWYIFFYSWKSIEPILYSRPLHDLAYPFIKPYYSFLCPVHYLYVSFFIFAIFLILHTSLRKPPVGATIWTFFSFGFIIINIKICTLEETVTFFFTHVYHQMSVICKANWWSWFLN